MKIRKLKFDDAKIAPWALGDKEPSIYTFAETLALCGLEDKEIRLSASMQRRLLGFPVFGKQAFKISADGRYWTWVMVGFGRDWETSVGPLSDIAIAVKRSLKISPSYRDREGAGV